MTQRRGDRRTDRTEVHHVHQEPTFDMPPGLIGGVASFKWRCFPNRICNPQIVLIYIMSLSQDSPHQNETVFRATCPHHIATETGNSSTTLQRKYPDDNDSIIIWLTSVIHFPNHLQYHRCHHLGLSENRIPLNYFINMLPSNSYFGG